MSYYLNVADQDNRILGKTSYITTNTVSFPEFNELKEIVDDMSGRIVDLEQSLRKVLETLNNEPEKWYYESRQSWWGELKKSDDIFWKSV